MKTMAEELFKEFREHSVSEFFRKNAAMLGYTGKIRSLTTIIHELVTNSLDACEDARVLPEIHVRTKKANDNPEHLKVIVEDNGPGIPEQFIPNVFGKMLAGTKLHRCVQQRGQQGIGCVGSVMYGQITAGTPTFITTSTGNGEIVQIGLAIDVNKNEGRIQGRKVEKGKWRGTRAEITAKEVTYIRSRYGPFNYLRMTAIANPHAQITFVEPDGTLTIFERATDEVPKRPKPMPLHPWGVMSDDLLVLAKHTKSRTVASFLTSELSRVTKRKVEEIKRLSGVNTSKKPSELTWGEAEQIVSAFKQIKFMAPPTAGLRPIGAQNIEAGMRQILMPEFVHAVTRPPKVYRGGLPFVIECCTGETKLVLEDGEIVSIKEFVENDINKKVYCMDGNLKIRPMKVLKKHKIPINHELFHIRTRTGREITLTGNNEIPVLRNGSLVWVMVDNVTGDDFIATPRKLTIRTRNPHLLDLLGEKSIRVHNRELVLMSLKQLKEKYGSYAKAARKIGMEYDRLKGFKGTHRPSLFELKKIITELGKNWENLKKEINRITIVDNKFPNPIPVNIPPRCTENLLHVLGLIQSDGYLTRGWKIGLVNTDQKLHRLFKQKIRGAFGLECRKSRYESYVNNKTAFKILQKIADTLPMLDDFLVIAWLKGFVDGDGWVSIRKDKSSHSEIGIATATKEKACLVQHLLLRLGIISTIRRMKQGSVGYIDGRKIETKKPEYNILISNRENIEKFANLISFRQTDRKAKLQRLLSTKVKERSSRDVIPVGLLLREVRAENNLYQHDLGLSDQSIRMIEKGKQNITHNNLRTMVDSLEANGGSTKKIKKLASADILWDKIVKKRKVTRSDESVYDLTTEAGNFVANDVVIHNCGIAYGGGAGKAVENKGSEGVEAEAGMDLIRFANRAPLIFDQGGCAITSAARSINWRRYGVDISTAPLTLFVNVSSAYVPYTSAGKQSIAEETEIFGEIRIAIMDIARELRRFLYRKIKVKERRERAGIFERYLPVIARKAAKLAGMREPNIKPLLREVTGVENAEEKES